MRIDYVRIEGMHKVGKVTYAFGDLNYFHGPNGAGKSTALEAVQLALLGYIPSTGKTKESIFKHCNGRTLSVTCRLSDGDQLIKITRAWTKMGSSIISSVEIEPKDYDLSDVIRDLELPIFNFSEFIGMTANKLKDWFINFLPSEYSRIDWKNTIRKCLSESGLEMSEDAVDQLIRCVSEFNLRGVDEVRKYNEILREELSIKKADLARIQSSIQTLTYHDDCDCSSDPEEINNKIAKLNSMLASSHKAKIADALNKKIEEELHHIAAKLAEERGKEPTNTLESLRSEYSSCENELVRIDSEISDLHRRIEEIETKIAARQKIINSEGMCPFTLTACQSINNQRFQFLSEVEILTEHLNELKAAFSEKSTEAANCKQRRYAINDMIVENELYHSNLIYMCKRMESLTQQLVEVSKEDLEIDETFVVSEIRRLTQLLAKLEANKQYNQLIDTLTKDKFETELYIEAVKALIKLTDANGLQTQMMVQPFKCLSNELDKYIQLFFEEGTAAKFNLSEKANSFSFGVDRNGVYVPFDLLSSGEKCLFALSLMTTIVRRFASPLKIILADDLIDHVDAQHRDRLFIALNEVEDVQYILAGVNNCCIPNAVIELK